MPRIFAALAFVAVLIALGPLAQAATQQYWNVCSANINGFKNHGAYDAAIMACSSILAGEETKPDRVKALLARANAYAGRGYNNTMWWRGHGPEAKDDSSYERAIADYASAIELDPKLVAAFIGRAHVHLLKRDRDSAIADFTLAIALDPANPSSYAERADLYLKANKLSLARADVGQALALEPANQAAESVLAELQRAELSTNQSICSGSNAAAAIRAARRF